MQETYRSNRIVKTQTIDNFTSAAPSLGGWSNVCRHPCNAYIHNHIAHHHTAHIAAAGAHIQTEGEVQIYSEFFKRFS